MCMGLKQRSVRLSFKSTEELNYLICALHYGKMLGWKPSEEALAVVPQLSTEFYNALAGGGGSELASGIRKAE